MDFEGILVAMLGFALIGFIAYLMPDIMKTVFSVVVAVLVIVFLIALVFGHAPLPHPFATVRH